jgi:hypothetical protein
MRKGPPLIDPVPDNCFHGDRQLGEVDPDILATCPDSHVPVPAPQDVISLEHWLDLCA